MIKIFVEKGKFYSQAKPLMVKHFTALTVRIALMSNKKKVFRSKKMNG